MIKCGNGCGKEFYRQLKTGGTVDTPLCRECYDATIAARGFDQVVSYGGASFRAKDAEVSVQVSGISGIDLSWSEPHYLSGVAQDIDTPSVRLNGGFVGDVCWNAEDSVTGERKRVWIRGRVAVGSDRIEVECQSYTQTILMDDVLQVSWLTKEELAEWENA